MSAWGIPADIATINHHRTASGAEQESQMDNALGTHIPATIVADQLYTPDEAASLLGMKSSRRVKTVANISRHELPIVWIGPRGGLKRYLGADLLAYINMRRVA